MRQRAALGSALLLSALLFVTSVDSQCHYLSPSYTPESCPKGEVSPMTEQKKASGIYNKLCCPVGPDKWYRDNADACVQTKCVSKATAASTRNLCSTDALETRLFIDDQEITFVESVRDECKGVDGNVNEIGVIGLCCREGSMDDYFTTLYGAETNEFPHFARVGAYGCGGTIYNEQWVITAAHCVVNHATHKVWAKSDGQPGYDKNVAQVRMNVNVRDVKSENTYNVSEVHVHPKSSYLKAGAETESYYDVALVKLDRKIKFGKNVKAIRIAESGFDPLKYGDYALLAGFGFTDTMRQSMKRQKANLRIRDKVYFSNQLYNNGELVMFAGGMHDGAVSPMVGTGDSGGPLLCRDKAGLAVLCGVVSFIPFPTEMCMASKSEDQCQPSVFNNVGVFHQWITEVAGGQQNAELEQQPLYGKAVGPTEYESSQVHVISSRGKCGGTLIDDDVVMTAASCVVDDNGNQMNDARVAIGVTDLKDGDGPNVIGVKTIAMMESVHKVSRPAWGARRRKRMVSLVLEKWQDGTLKNSDIMKDPYFNQNVAILKLKSKAGKPTATLATQSPKTGDMADEVAFPLKPLGTEADGALPLSKREFKMLSREDCQWRMDKLKPLNYNVQIDNMVMCGVENFSGGSMCDRELGGGLYCKEGGQDVLCGIQISRLCEFNIPNEFIDVASIKPWADSVLASVKNM